MLKEKKYPHVFSILRTFEKYEKEVFIIGGSIRDLVLGKEPHDFDLATNAEPNQIIAMFPKVIPTGIVHGTVSIVHEEEIFEVTTYRTEQGYKDKRHPDKVIFGNSIHEDLKRRDFTINAMAYNPLHDTFIDLAHGEKDCFAGIIQTIGDPRKRFEEDALRILRALRFKSQLGFDIEEHTCTAMQHKAHTLLALSGKRIQDELIKLLSGKYCVESLRLAQQLDIIHYIIPELERLVDCEQNEHHQFDVWQHTLHTVGYISPEKPLLRLAALLHDIGKPVTKKIGEKGNVVFYNHENEGAVIAVTILKRMLFSNQVITYVTKIIKNHMIHYTNEWKQAAIIRLVKKVGPDEISDLLELYEADMQAKSSKGISEQEKNSLQELKESINSIFHRSDTVYDEQQLALNGNDIMDTFSMPSGPEIGYVLKYLFDCVIDGTTKNERETLLQKASEYFKNFMT